MSVGVAVLELRHGLELILGRIHDGVVRIPSFVSRARTSRCLRDATRGGPSGACQRLFHKIELIETDQDVPLAQSEETAHSDDQARYFTGLIEQDLTDAAKFLILRYYRRPLR
jgi:hypothetical protein